MRSWLLRSIFLLFGYFLMLPEISAQAIDTVYQIRKLEITGNRKTKEYIITRELDLQVNDTISSRTLKTKLERNRQRVFNTRLFVYVQVVPRFEGNLVDITLEVKENWYIGGGLAFKLVDRNFNEWWNDRDHDLNRVIYGVSLRHSNFRGRRENLRIVFETGFSDRYQVSYDIPYIDRKKQTGITLLARYREFKNVPYNTENNKLLFSGNSETDVKTQFEAGLNFRRRQGFYTTHRLDLSYTHERITDTLLLLNPFYQAQSKLEQRFFQVGYLFSYDNRDNVNYPVKGEVLAASLRQRGILPNDNYFNFEVRVGAGYYRPLTSRWSMGFVGKGQTSFPKNQPFSQLKGIGYQDDYLRGFDLYVINGTSFGVSRSNLRYKLFDKLFPLKFIPIKQFNVLPLATYINFFTDAGYTHYELAGRERQNDLSNKLLLSAGVGLDIIALLNMTMRVNYSHNNLRQNNIFINFQKDF